MHVLHTFDVIVLKFRILHLNQAQMALNGECHNFNLDQWLCSLGLWGSIKKEEPAGPIIVGLAAGECVVSCSCNFCCYMGWVIYHRWHLGTVPNACLWPVWTCSIYGMLCALLIFTCSFFCRRSVAALSTCDGDVCGVKNFPIFFKNLYLRGTALLHKGEFVLAWPARMFRVPNIFSMGRHGEGHGMG